MWLDVNFFRKSATIPNYLFGVEFQSKRNEKPKAKQNSFNEWFKFQFDKSFGHLDEVLCKKIDNQLFVIFLRRNEWLGSYLEKCSAVLELWFI